MARSAAEQMMHRETSLSYGTVPNRIGDKRLAECTWEITDDAFLLRGHGDLYFFYERGKGVTVSRGPKADAREEKLWLNGSVYAAIASINGLLPIHASAVAVDGAVYAFSGPAGAGKSTLIAALGQKGLPMFCDDTLVLDIRAEGPILCLPGHKRLKLTPDGLELTGATAGERVAHVIDKYYAAPPAGEVGEALPLAELVFLEPGPDIAIGPITGFERFARINDDHYTAELYAGARHLRPAARFEHLSKLANTVTMARFSRPIDPSTFNPSVDFAFDYLMNRAKR